MSLRARFTLYLIAVHVLLATAGVYFLRQNRLWLFAVEAVFVTSLLTGVALVRRMFRALAFVGDSAQFLNDSDYTARFLAVGQPEIDRLIGVYNRMVDSLRAERQRVHEQHYFLGRILDVSPSGIVVLDLDERIDLVNPAAERSLQRPADALRGVTLTAVDAPLLDSLASLAPARGARHRVAGRQARPRAARHVSRPRLRAQLLLLEELTEELRESEKAADEKLIRMMSHEVNNSVGASSSLLQSSLSYSAQLTAGDRTDFERALQIAIDRMGQLNVFMRSFADVVRLPAPARRPVDLADVLRRIEGLVRADRDARGIAWEWGIDEEPAVVSVDPVQIEQALLNIVKNAIEAIHDGVPPNARRADLDGAARGTVTVRLKRADNRLRLEVEDTGPGMPPEVRDQLFTPFFTTKPHGQGIGLTMVQEILSNHALPFRLDSAPGGPTTFSIEF